MKTAISLPDALGHAADLFAQQREMSRSELYATALREYMDRHKGDDLTDAINRIIKRQHRPETHPQEDGVRTLRDLKW